MSIFSLLVCRESPNLSPNRAIILIRLVVENALVVEDRPYFLGESLRLQITCPLAGVGDRMQLRPVDACSTISVQSSL